VYNIFQILTSNFFIWDLNVDGHISISTNEEFENQIVMLDADILEQPSENSDISKKVIN